MKTKILALALILSSVFALPLKTEAHTFDIGEQDFLLDKKPFQIRCGELHYERIPKAYWRHRLQLCKAMGLNAVCCYLFWNFHEWNKGHFDWSDEKDASEFCKIAQEEGLWVILRPGPYSCAEWEMGGVPWWLLKNDIKLRTRDPAFVEASRAWLQEVGRVFTPLQVTHGGPIILVQVENEYGAFGEDAEYIRQMRKATLDAGFDVPLFQCNPASLLKNGRVEELFLTANFGDKPKEGFAALRKLQPKGPLFCSEFYPGWFDEWGFPHHTGNTEKYIGDLDYMLSHKASFSIYMVHGGTTFGMWSGADQPFLPDTSSYDYDAPISEAGWIGDKYNQTRNLMAKYLQEGEMLPEPPAANSTVAIPAVKFTESASIFDNLPDPISDTAPGTMEKYDQGQGCILYRTNVPAGGAATLKAKEVHDIAWVFLNGKLTGIMDRRNQKFQIDLPPRNSSQQLDILVEAMGRVNFGKGMHDRKGLHAPVQLADHKTAATDLSNWQIYTLPFGPEYLARVNWQTDADTSTQNKTARLWHGTFNLAKAGDTFLDMSSWGKGDVWLNGKCLSRYWNIGPTQTIYASAPFLKQGHNEIIVLDLPGPRVPEIQGLKLPILDALHPELDFNPSAAKLYKPHN